MLQVKPLPQDDRDHRTATKSAVSATLRPLTGLDADAGVSLPANTAAVLPAPLRKANQPPFPTRKTETRDLQTRVPAIIGEVSFRGVVQVDGIISGQPGANGGATSLRQRGRTFFDNDPELNGEITFVDMLRVNGHIAGSVFSRKGTIIVDTAARVDANVEVAIAVISGTVKGDIVATQRVELASTAKIYGNIWTRSLAIQNGAIFDGVCQMIEGRENE
jgi:cytoskeletal protein CcmA (bactofilin family)